MESLVAALREFQILVTGILAIAAAYIAYRGALAQARATVAAADARSKSECRSAAGALWAELGSCLVRLRADQIRLEKLRSSLMPGGIGDSKFHPIDLSVYEANPAAVGHLPPDDGYVVVSAYKLLQELNRTYTGPSAYFEVMEHKVASAMEMITTTLRGLQQTAGIPQDKADAVLSAMRRVAPD